MCHKCAQSEEELYQIVYRFLRKRENRAATVERIVEATGRQRSYCINGFGRVACDQPCSLTLAIHVITAVILQQPVNFVQNAKMN